MEPVELRVPDIDPLLVSHVADAWRQQKGVPVDLYHNCSLMAGADVIDAQGAVSRVQIVPQNIPAGNKTR